MRSVLPFLMWLPVVAGAATTDESLAGLLERHTAARGGAPAIEAIRTVRFAVTIAEPGFTVDGRYTAVRDGSMRIDVFADGQRVFTEALDGGRAWSRGQGELAPVETGTRQGAAALRHGVEAPFKLFGLHEMQGRGHRLTLEGRETLDGIEYHVIRATLDDGYETRYYLNPTTWLIDRERQQRALHVDVDPAVHWIETVFEEYRPTAGVLFSRRQVERQVPSGTVLATTIVRGIEVNVPLEPALFRAP